MTKLLEKLRKIKKTPENKTEQASEQKQAFKTCSKELSTFLSRYDIMYDTCTIQGRINEALELLYQKGKLEEARPFAEEMSEIILNSSDMMYFAEHITKFATYAALLGLDIKKYEDIVLNPKGVSRTAYASNNYNFAKDVIGADIEAHGKAVIKTGDIYYNLRFARDIKGADVKAHGEVIINSGNPEYNYNFAHDVKGADIKAHGEAIINSCDPEYNYRFAKDVIGANVKDHSEAIISSDDISYNYLFIHLLHDEETVKKHASIILNALANDPVKYEKAKNGIDMVLKRIASEKAQEYIPEKRAQDLYNERMVALETIKELNIKVAKIDGELRRYALKRTDHELTAIFPAEYVEVLKDEGKNKQKKMEL